MDNPEYNQTYARFTSYKTPEMIPRIDSKKTVPASAPAVAKENAKVVTNTNVNKNGSDSGTVKVNIEANGEATSANGVVLVRTDLLKNVESDSGSVAETGLSNESGVTSDVRTTDTPMTNEDQTRAEAETIEESLVEETIEESLVKAANEAAEETEESLDKAENEAAEAARVANVAMARAVDSCNALLDADDITIDDAASAAISATETSLLAISLASNRAGAFEDLLPSDDDESDDDLLPSDDEEAADDVEPEGVRDSLNPKETPTYGTTKAQTHAPIDPIDPIDPSTQHTITTDPDPEASICNATTDIDTTVETGDDGINPHGLTSGSISNGTTTTITSATTRSEKPTRIGPTGPIGPVVPAKTVVPTSNPMDMRDEATGIPLMFMRSHTESKVKEKASKAPKKGKPIHGKPKHGKRTFRNSKHEIEVCPHWSKKRCPRKDKCTYLHWPGPNTASKPTSSKSCPTDKQQGPLLSKDVLASSASLPLIAGKHPLESTNPGKGTVTSVVMGVPKMSTIDEYDS
jgi:hypothetical protein